MKIEKLVKIGYALVFLALSGIICWATAESLHMLLPSWRHVLCYWVTIAFFIIASYGTKVIVYSRLNADSCKKPCLYLSIGFVMLWLICGIPATTHTYFYRSVATTIAKADIEKTTDYLNQLVNDTQIENDNKEVYQNEAKTAIINLQWIADVINNFPSVITDMKVTHELDNRLLVGYTIINKYNNFITFDNETDKEQYLIEQPQTKIKRLISVFSVWKDMFQGKYKEYDFVSWIIYSILLNVSVFIIASLAIMRVRLDLEQNKKVSEEDNVTNKE